MAEKTCASFVEKIFIKNNININFFLFCLKKDAKLIRFIFLNIFYFVLSLFINRNIYEKNKFRYLKFIKNIDDVINEYKTKKVKYLDYFEIKSDILICKSPEIIVKKIFNDKKVIAYHLDEKYKVDLEMFNKSLNNLNVDILYINKIKDIINCNYKNIIVNNRIMKIVNNKMVYILKKLSKIIITIFMLVLLSLFLTMISFLYTHQVFEPQYLDLYKDSELVLMNFIPIFIVMLSLYLITAKISIAFLLTGLAVFFLGVANQTKLVYRDDVVKFNDLILFKEASIMMQRYNIVIKKYTIVFFVAIVLMFLFLNCTFKKDKTIWWKRVIILIVFIFNIVIFSPKYFDNHLYEQLGDKSEINVWIDTRQSQIRGLIYPFVYSIQENRLTHPDGYSKEKVEELLNNYNYENMTNKQKVNIIAIMLEAYNDFTKFKELNLKEDVYKDLHDIEKDSIYGNLVTTIFGGGTIVTERNFLTGYETLSNFRSPTNSFVWYLKEQGYYTDGDHPIYGAFYNRRTVNNNLGFENYDFYEEKFNTYRGWGGFASDKELFSEIIKSYEEHKKDGRPYFNFSVTYQNHGPYVGEDYIGKNYYFTNNNISHNSYNVINEYFDGIKDTNKQLKELISYFEDEEEPTIIILFGDHNPYLGDGYTELNINMDINTLDGYQNYYDTLYIFHANKSAKQIFEKSFKGKGNTISPMFLLPELFDYIGINGNQYMQYMINLKNKIDVINGYYYKESNKFIQSYDNVLVNEYRCVNYYLLNNFKEGRK